MVVPMMLFLACPCDQFPFPLPLLPLSNVGPYLRHSPKVMTIILLPISCKVSPRVPIPFPSAVTRSWIRLWLGLSLSLSLLLLLFIVCCCVLFFMLLPNFYVKGYGTRTVRGTRWIIIILRKSQKINELRPIQYVDEKRTIWQAIMSKSSRECKKAPNYVRCWFSTHSSAVQPTVRYTFSTQ